MYPILFEIGPIPIRTYGLMIAIGFLTALFFIQREAKKKGIDPEVISNAAFWALLLGIAGTRVLHIMMFPAQYSWTDPVGWIALWQGGLVFQGGPPVVMVFLYFYFKKYAINFWQVADITAPFLALGHGIGRLGCFAYGCCYGKPTDSFLGTAFPRYPRDPALALEGSPAYIEHLYSHQIAEGSLWSLPVHPTQLYSFAGLVLIGVLLYLIKRKWQPFYGSILSLYFVFYGIFRFIVEFYRGDRNPTHFGALSDQQVFCFVFIALGVGLFLWLRHRNRRLATA